MQLTQSPSALPAETAARLLALAENLGLILFRCQVAPALRIEWISPNTEPVIGYAQEAWLLSPRFILPKLKPDDSAALLTDLQQPGWSTLTHNLRFQRPTGVWDQVELHLNAIRSPSGELTHVEGAVRLAVSTQDLTLDPLDNRTLLSNVINAGTDAVIVLDPQLNIQVFNPAAESMFACQAAEVLGHPINRFLPGDIADWHADQVRSTDPRNNTSKRMGRTHVTSGVRANGEVFPMEASISTFESGGKTYYAAVMRDITERKQIEDQLRFMSTHDALTGLYNRFFFEAELQRIEQRRAGVVSIIYADVDGLKYINDSLGHSAGDQLLRDVSAAIQAAFRPVDVVARLGGDEFGVLLPDASAELAASAVHRIYSNITRMKAEKPDIPFGLSIGAATSIFNEPITETIRRADSAMYTQKNRRTSPPRRP